MKIKNCLKKTLPYIIALSIGTSLITGCKETKYEWQDKCERATISKEYQPPKKSGYIFPFGGWWFFGEEQIPEHYTMLIKCEHKGIGWGWHTIHNNKEIYEKFEEGQVVKLPYKALVKLVYDDKDGDGKKELVESKEIRCDDHDFWHMEKLEK